MCSGHSFPIVSDRDQFIDWLEYNDNEYNSNVDIYVYSDTYIKAKLDKGETLEGLYHIDDYVCNDITTRTTRIY